MSQQTETKRGRRRRRPFGGDEEAFINHACGWASLRGRIALLASDVSRGELTLAEAGPFHVERLYREADGLQRLEIAIARDGRTVFHVWYEERRRRNGDTFVVEDALTFERGAWRQEFLALEPPADKA